MNTVAAGINYVLKNRIPREQDWKLTGCDNKAVIGADITYYNVIGKVALLPLKGALVYLHTQPIAAKLHLFDCLDKFKPVSRFSQLTLC